MRAGRAVAVLLAAVLAACGPTGSPSSRPSPTPSASASPSASPSPHVQRFSLNGVAHPVEPGETVGSALTRYGAEPRTGRLLAVVSHRVLRGNGLPGTVLLGGTPVALTALLRDGDVVVTHPGPDTVEGVVTRTASIPVPGLAGLYVGGRPGSAVVVRGAVSGEVVSRRVLTEPVLGHLRTPGSVVLTFDDGPDPTWTPQVLSLLARHHVHAVFCEIGKHVAAHPDLTRRVHAAGDLLCDHTWDHDLALRTRTTARIQDDISRGYAAIAVATGVGPLFFRAPGGNWSAAVEQEAVREHMALLRWNVDPQDWTRPGVAQILATVYRQLRPGGVILLHDGGGDRSQTLAALAQLLDRLPAMGYRFVLPTPP